MLSLKNSKAHVVNEWSSATPPLAEYGGVGRRSPIVGCTTASRWRVFILYWLPAIAIVAAGAPAISSAWRTRLDCRARHNGSGVYCERASLWACALLPHWPFLHPDSPRRIVVRSRHPASRRERLEPARPNSPDRRHCSLVPARDVFGKISEGSCGRRQPSLSHSLPVCSSSDHNR